MAGTRAKLLGGSPTPSLLPSPLLYSSLIAAEAGQVSYVRIILYTISFTCCLQLNLDVLVSWPKVCLLFRN